ncbi:MAG: EAL domain-containing protein [Gemmatimonadaceae bacterium]
MFTSVIEALEDWGRAGASPLRSLDENTRARVRAAQLQAVLRFTPLTMVVNLVNFGLVALTLWGIVDPRQLIAWGLCLAVASAMGLRGWLATRAAPQRTRASIRGFRRSTLHAAILAALWAAVPVFWFAPLDPMRQLVSATVTTGMICAGGFVLATVPSAAFAFVVVLSLGAFVGIVQSDSRYTFELAGLLVAYAAVVLRGALGTAQLFIDRFIAEILLYERGQVIGLLLNEFEDKGSDWLFELDRDLCIVEHSPRFAEVCRLDGPTLSGVRLPDLIEPASREDLLNRIAVGRPFRKLEVSALGPEGLRWWSISASPIIDERGRFSGWRGVGSDTTNVKQAQDKVAWMAATDILTGLKNRTSFRELAAAALSASRTRGSTMAIGCLDLDYFKSVNDTLGHPAGDLLLREVARDLAEFEKHGVTVGRLGGDEFGLLFQSMGSPRHVHLLAEQIIERVSVAYEIQGSRVTVGASVGIAFGPEDGDTVDDLLRNADLALYRSKDRARGKAVRYTGSMLREAEEKRSIKEDLGIGLARGEFQLYFQPILDVQASAPVAMEALVRWQHPTRGLLAPDAFIGVAEASGMISPLGDWILAEACRQASRWPEHLRVAVNLSPAQLGRASLLHSIVDALSRAGLPANRLELEITEALLLSHEAQTLQFISEMHALGIRIALDDFGTGFSSLNYLTRYRVNTIKIDRSFVSGGASRDDRAAIIEAVTGLASKLGCTTTAEGVETEESFAWVTSLGCTHVQGYHFAKPMPATAVSSYLAGDVVAGERGGLRLVV